MAVAKPRQTNQSYRRDVIGGSEKGSCVPDLPISVIISMDMKVFHGGVGTILSALLPPPLWDGHSAQCSGWAAPGLPCKAPVCFVFLEIGVLSKADRLILPYQGSSATVNGFL